MTITKHRPHRMLREFREALGLSQDEFGARAKVHRGYVCQLEAGQFRLGHTVGMRLARAYRSELIAAGISLQDLLEEQTRPL